MGNQKSIVSIRIKGERGTFDWPGSGSGGGFLRGGGGFLRLNLTFGPENGGHAVPIRLDIFAGIVKPDFRTPGFAHIFIRNGFSGAPGDFDGENAIVIVNATGIVFLANFKSVHVTTSIY